MEKDKISKRLSTIEVQWKGMENLTVILSLILPISFSPDSFQSSPWKKGQVVYRLDDVLVAVIGSGTRQLIHCHRIISCSFGGYVDTVHMRSKVQNLNK